MAFSAHKNADEVKEFVDSPADLERKIDLLVNLIRNAKHFVAFTGAGVSTSAGIPGMQRNYECVLRDLIYSQTFADPMVCGRCVHKERRGASPRSRH